MLFVELRFFVFFAIVLGVYWSLRSNSQRKWFLLAASYFFYGSWDWRFAGMLFCLSVADYVLSRFIYDAVSTRRRKLYVCASVAMNLSVLGYFKYFDFFADSAIRLSSFFGIQLSEFTLNVILPVGISFFTFQSLSYTIDVYRREIEPAKSLRDYVLFAAFFPQLVAGPIVRPKYFLPQLKSERVLLPSEIKPLLILFLLGFFKKTCLADNISPFVDQIFHSPAEFSTLAAITGVWLYATQIYCDFSGYTDMAIAVAGLLGYKLAINFDAPYLAASVQDFWRRWHISLSTWIRDYVYITLGGRSDRNYVTYRNLMITMLAGGLWHGAAWTFVVWGGIHGAALVINHEFRRIMKNASRPIQIPKLVSWFLTINFVCIAWIFFRSPDFSTSLIVLKKYLLLDLGGERNLPMWLTAFAPILLLLQWAIRRFNVVSRAAELPLPTFSLGYGACWAVTLASLPLGYRPFIYFQF